MSFINTQQKKYAKSLASTPICLDDEEEIAQAPRSKTLHFGLTSAEKTLQKGPVGQGGAFSGNGGLSKMALELWPAELSKDGFHMRCSNHKTAIN